MALTRLGPNNSTNISGINLTSQVTGTLPAGNGGTGSTTFSPGKVVGTAHALYASETATNSGSYVATGLTCNYTPTSTSNSLLVYVNHAQFYVNGANTSFKMQLYKDGTAVRRVGWDMGYQDSACHTGGTSFVYADTISSTSQVTYATYFFMSNGGGYVYSSINNTPATLTIMEIAA